MYGFKTRTCLCLLGMVRSEYIVDALAKNLQQGEIREKLTPDHNSQSSVQVNVHNAKFTAKRVNDVH